MIVFSGAISSNVEKKTKQLRGKREGNIIILFTIFWACIFTCFNIGDIRGTIIYVVLIIIVALLIKYVPANISHSYYYHITIDMAEIVCVDRLLDKTRKKPFGRVKKVIDADECYYIIFKFGDIISSIICQKDLIREGTLEEFEELFKGKIVKEKEKKVFKRKNK